MAETRARSVGAVRRSFAPWGEGAEPLIRIEKVSKRFGPVTAVDGVDLAIYEREFFSLLGPSGCGKTTLLRMLAGFEAPDEGRILLGGQDLTALPPYRRPVNMMFQSYALFPHLSVFDNIAFGLRREGASRALIAERVSDMLRLVKLDGLGGRRIDQLSGGQRQRVALARAIAKRPRVLLLDEPLGALDKKLREETQFELMDLQMDLGLTFVIVTHDQEEAMTMSDRIAIMDQGRLAQVSTPAEVYEEPASRAVAQFVGDINLFEGRVVGRKNGLVVIEVPDLDARFLDDAPQAMEIGAALALAVRPEKMLIGRRGAVLGAVNIVEGTIYDIAYLGDWTVYRVELANRQIVRVSRANAARFVDEPLTWDDPVVVGFSADAGVVLTR